MKSSCHKIIFLFISLLGVCLTPFAQERDSIYVYQDISDSFTKHGIPDVFITLTDTNGILIDTLWAKSRYNSRRAAWSKWVSRKPHTFLVKAEHPDYETIVQRVAMNRPARQMEYKFPELFVKRKMKETTMQELTVSATQVRIAYKGDTIVVNAEVFKIPEGSMLDALVANIPGAELHDDGTIYMNKRKVDYLTLNGKDFFKGKNRMMLDNLPYYVVNKLKFYEKDMPYSQMIHKDTGEKDYVMDVELKQEYSIGYTVNAEAGIGTNNKWMARLFGLRFTDNSRMVLFGSANNINEVRQPGRDGWYDKSKIPIGEKEVKMIGGNLNIDDKHGRFVENVDASVNWTDNKDETRTSQETFLPEGSAYSRLQDISSNRNFSGSLSNKLELKKIGLTFNTDGSYNKQHGDVLSRSATFASAPSMYTCIQVLDSIFSSPVNPMLQDININRVLDQGKYNSYNYSFHQAIDWDKTLPWGDDIIFSLNGSYDKSANDRFSRFNLSYPNGRQTDNMQDRFMPYRHHGYSYSTMGRYNLNLLGGWYAKWTYDYAQQYSNTESNLYRLDRLGFDTDFGVLPSQIDYLKTKDDNNSYHSLYMTKSHKNTISLGRNHSGKKTYLFFAASLGIVYKKEDVRYWRSNQYSFLRQGNWYMEPEAWIRYQIKRDSCKVLFDWIDAKIGSYVQTPNLVQMLDLEDSSDPLAINKGNPDLKKSRRHHVELQMYGGVWERRYGVALDVNIIDNMVANGFTYNPQNGVYTYCPENVNGNWNAQASPYFRTNLDKDNHYQLESKTGFNYVHNVDLAMIEGFNTSQLSRVNHFVTSENLKISYNKNVTRFELVGTFAWNVVARQYTNSNNINAFDFSYGISGQHTFPWKIQSATDLKMYSRRGYEESSMNTNELVWNASLSRPFLKGKLLVKVDAFDILGQLSSTRYTVNGQGRTETWQLMMPRYAMLRVAYKFNKNPKKKQKE